MEELIKEKETPLNVFIGESDVNAENEKIEEERKKRMEEINIEVAAKAPRLSFIDSLKTRLEQQLTVHSPELNSQEQAEEEITTNIPAPAAKRPRLAKPDIKLDNIPKDLQAKNTTPIEGTIQRLQQILPPTTNIDELEPQNLDFEEEIVFDGCFTIKKTKGRILYACLKPTCILASDSSEIFMRHCRHAHTSIIGTKCRLCQDDVTYGFLEGLFVHVLTVHHNEIVKGTEMDLLRCKIEMNEEDPIAPPPLVTPPTQPLLRMRRLSGDILSEKKKEEIKEEEAVVVMDENSGFPFKITSVTSQVSARFVCCFFAIITIISAR